MNPIYFSMTLSQKSGDAVKATAGGDLTGSFANSIVHSFLKCYTPDVKEEGNGCHSSKSGVTWPGPKTITSLL